MKTSHYIPLLLATASLATGQPAATPEAGTSATTPPLKVTAPETTGLPGVTSPTPGTSGLPANPAVIKVNQLQAELGKAVQKLAENNPELASARALSAEASRDSFKSIGAHPDLKPIREKRGAVVNKLGNALKIQDKAAVAEADAELKAIAAELEAKIASIPELVAKRDKAKAARENFQQLRDKAIAASPEAKKLQDELEEARKALPPAPKPATVPAPAASPAPANP